MGLIRRLEAFGLSPALLSAAEAVEAAIVEGQERRAVDAARRLVASEVEAVPLIREQAAGLLIRNGFQDDVPEGIIRLAVVDRSRWRLLTRLHPRDALAWVELAFHQTVSGHPRAATRSMNVALQLAPDDRHVLRSASRLWLHRLDPTRAHAVIARSAALAADPWLMAAEIALAGVAAQDPVSYKTGLRILGSAGLEPRQITELAGAIGTLELLEGRRKKARDMFARSMSDPTGSALAQGEWASPHFGSEIVPANRLASAPEAHEANALHLYRLGEYADVTKMCERWADADAFSIRPQEFGASTANRIDDYETAERLAKAGLQRKPQSVRLLNSAAFASASAGRPDEADAYLKRIRVSALSEAESYLTAANKGLVAFRQGDVGTARAIYEEAVDGFRRLGRDDLAAIALAYLAREAVRAGEPDADAVVERARSAAHPFPTSQASSVLAVMNSSGVRGGVPAGRGAGAVRRSTPRPTWSIPGLPAAFRTDVIDCAERRSGGSPKRPR